MNKGKKANVISTIALVVLLLVGLSVMLYPIFSDWWNSHTQSIAITDYDKVVKDTVDEKKIEMLKSAQQFNKNLLTIENRFSTTTKIPGYEGVLDVSGTGVMGYITIPSINVELPIYHGTSPEVLNIAVGHMEGSSLPIGGESTHAVISAHRGLPSASLFTDLDKLEEGDHFLLYILDDVLCYEVDQILVVEPDETESLAVQEGQDLVTLLTCTPYGVNSHRLLVRGHRVPYEPEVIEDENQIPLAGVSLHTNYLLWVLVGLAVTAGFVAFLYLMDRKRRKASQIKDQETSNHDIET